MDTVITRHPLADPIAPVEPELAIAFEDCDRPPMPGRVLLSREGGRELQHRSRTESDWWRLAWTTQ
jgi:hypothetical protein